LINISLKGNINRGETGISFVNYVFIFLGGIILEQKFELCNRIKHVLSEANRVLIFKQVCDSNTHDRIETLGELMNQSHNSCSRLYECSSDQLDELTDICRYVIFRKFL
jgi:galactokinase